MLHMLCCSYCHYVGSYMSIDGDQVSDNAPCIDLTDFGINVNRVTKMQLRI